MRIPLLDNAREAGLHLCALNRLMWLPIRESRTRAGALREYLRLERLARQLRNPNALMDVLAQTFASDKAQRNGTQEELSACLQSLRIALYIHPTASSLCVAKSLRILRLLNASGLRGDNVRLRMGVRQGRRGLRGHAWVEHNGTRLLEEPAPDWEYPALWEQEELLGATQSLVDVHGPYRADASVLVKQIAPDEAALLHMARGTSFTLVGEAYAWWRELTARGDLPAEEVSDNAPRNLERTAFLSALIQEQVIAPTDKGA